MFVLLVCVCVAKKSSATFSDSHRIRLKLHEAIVECCRTRTAKTKTRIVVVFVCWVVQGAARWSPPVYDYDYCLLFLSFASWAFPTTNWRHGVQPRRQHQLVVALVSMTMLVVVVVVVLRRWSVVCSHSNVSRRWRLTLLRSCSSATLTTNDARHDDADADDDDVDASRHETSAAAIRQRCCPNCHGQMLTAWMVAALGRDRSSCPWVASASACSCCRHLTTTTHPSWRLSLRCLSCSHVRSAAAVVVVVVVKWLRHCLTRLRRSLAEPTGGWPDEAAASNGDESWRAGWAEAAVEDQQQQRRRRWSDDPWEWAAGRAERAAAERGRTADGARWAWRRSAGRHCCWPPSERARSVAVGVCVAAAAAAGARQEGEAAGRHVLAVARRVGFRCGCCCCRVWRRLAARVALGGGLRRGK